MSVQTVVTKRQGVTLTDRQSGNSSLLDAELSYRSCIADKAMTQYADGKTLFLLLVDERGQVDRATPIQL